VQAEAKYAPVYQRFGIKRGGLVEWKDGDNGATYAGNRVDYWTNTNGGISIAHTAVTPSNQIEVMDDLPLYDGYDYSLTPPAPAASAALDGKPRRRKLTVYVRTAANRYQTPDEYNDDGGAQVSNDPDGITVEWAGDEEGTRLVSDNSDKLTFTVGLRMPQRVRLGTAISGTVRTRRRISIPDMHLWIAHPGCIWDLDGANEDADGKPAKRVGVTTADLKWKILRDDRAALARAHYLAWEWYRSDSTRRSVSYSLRACGLLPSWTDLTGTAIPYPTMGKIIGTLKAAGETMRPITPVTQIEYDNATGVTSWATDWTELDGGAFGGARG
jgi:hypothetical protein